MTHWKRGCEPAPPGWEEAQELLRAQQRPRCLPLKKEAWISSSAWSSDHIFFRFFMCITPIFKNNCEWKKSSRHFAFIDQSSRGILMHMNKFHFPEIVDIRSRLSCLALLRLAQNTLLWGILHQCTHTDRFKFAWMKEIERLKYIFKMHYITCVYIDIYVEIFICNLCIFFVDMTTLELYFSQ